MSLAAKPWEVGVQERSRRARSLLVQAALSAPTMAERGTILEDLAELPDPGEAVPARWPEQGASRDQRSAAKQDGATAAMVSTEHKVANGWRNKQLFPSHHFLTIISPCHPTHPTTLIFDLLSKQFPTNRGGSLPLQCIISPPHFRVHAAYRAGPKCRGKTTNTGHGSATVPSQKPQPTLAAVKEHRSKTVQRTWWGAVRSIIRRAGQRGSEGRRSGPRAHLTRSPSRQKPQQSLVGAAHSNACRATQHRRQAYGIVQQAPRQAAGR